MKQIRIEAIDTGDSREPFEVVVETWDHHSGVMLHSETIPSNQPITVGVEPGQVVVVHEPRPTDAAVQQAQMEQHEPEQPAEPLVTGIEEVAKTE